MLYLTHMCQDAFEMLIVIYRVEFQTITYKWRETKQTLTKPYG